MNKVYGKVNKMESRDRSYFLHCKEKTLFIFAKPNFVSQGHCDFLKQSPFGDFDESLQNALKIMGDEHICICTPNLDYV